MNTFAMCSVQGRMGKWFALGLLVLAGCGSAIDAAGLGADDKADTGNDPSETSSGDVQPEHSSDTVALGDTSPSEVADEGSDDSSPSDAVDGTSDTRDTGGADVSPGSDSAVGEDGVGSEGSWDGGCGVPHQCALGDFAYTSCTPSTYNTVLLTEQINQAKAANPSWIWSGSSGIQCDGTHPYPVAAGEPCTRATATTGGGLLEAVWCASGALAGRFRKTSDPVNVCPYAADPVAWW